MVNGKTMCVMATAKCSSGTDLRENSLTLDNIRMTVSQVLALWTGPRIKGSNNLTLDNGKMIKEKLIS